MTCLAMPSKCLDVSWSAFDSQGWADCGMDNLFVREFYQGSSGQKDKPISLLDDAKCCSAVFAFIGEQGECTRTTGWRLDRYKNL